MKIKETFLKLSFQKVSEIYKVLDNTKKRKPKINMMTKGPSRKQIIILINTINSERVIAKLNVYIANINRLLKEVKSNISADYIYSNSKEIIITTNKAATISDLNIIEKYVEELNEVNTVNLY